MRGYFGIGAEGISKPYNLGAVLRTGNAFGASFAFTVNADHRMPDIRKTDTSRTDTHLPFYQWENADALILPKDCVLVGIELTPDAVNLPSFRHPKNCAYVLGPEKGELSPEMQARCTHMVKIPTKFCINVSLAAALTLYDRSICMGGHPERPIMPGGPKMDDIDKWQVPRSKKH